MVPGTLPTPARYVRTRLFKNLQAILAWNYRVNLNINISTSQHITRHQRFYVFRVKCLGYFGPIRIRFFWGKIISILSELLSTTPQITVSFQFHYQPFTPPCLGGSTGAAKIKSSRNLCVFYKLILQSPLSPALQFVQSWNCLFLRRLQPPY